MSLVLHCLQVTRLFFHCNLCCGLCSGCEEENWATLPSTANYNITLAGCSVPSGDVVYRPIRFGVNHIDTATSEWGSECPSSQSIPGYRHQLFRLQRCCPRRLLRTGTATPWGDNRRGILRRTERLGGFFRPFTMEGLPIRINLVGRWEAMITTGKGGISRRKQEKVQEEGLASWVYHAQKFDSPSVPVHGNRFQKHNSACLWNVCTTNTHTRRRRPGKPHTSLLYLSVIFRPLPRTSLAASGQV